MNPMLRPKTNRRAFLRAAGLGGAAVALAGCGDADPTRPTGFEPTAAEGDPILAAAIDFSGDSALLNVAYAVEQLGAAFYGAAVASPYGGMTEAERSTLADIRDHEIVHRDVLAAALGEFALPVLSINLASVAFSDRGSVLRTAVEIADIAVASWNGMARFIVNPTVLSLAAAMVSVDARHAAAVHDLLAPRTGGFAPSTTDVGLAPGEALGLLDRFLFGPTVQLAELRRRLP